MKKLIVILGIAVTSSIVLSIDKNKEHPTEDWKAGFKAGVKWGLMSCRQMPLEDSISVHETNALYNYWKFEIAFPKYIESLKTNK